MRIEFRILGPLEVSVDGRVLPLGSPKQRALLALLLIHANETVSRDRLIEELWGDAAPASVESAFHVYLSRLRRLLDSAGGNGLLVRQAHGYRLRVERDRLDATRFAGLVGEGREALAAGEAERAVDRFRQALALWRGPPLADLVSERFAISAAARLEEERVSALEQRLEADLALARHRELVGELETLVAEHPYRERLRAQLMLALYRSGRQAEALRAYQQARRTLADELGLEPGHELKELEQAILRQDPRLTVERVAKLKSEPRPSSPPPSSIPAPREERKVVTVLFADLVGYTAQAEPLDPEDVRTIQDRYWVPVRAAIERHGGTVEKFIGDAVMAVFGIPAVHEDDALRACRAAVEMRGALPELEVEGRIGVATGEVVTGTEERLATGDVVNVAARLQHAAQPGEALVGDDTLALVGSAVDVEAVEPLVLKGKAQPVQAYRLLAVREAPERRRETRFVGRRRELAAIHEAWERAVVERRCDLVTIVGEAGVGKSRLVAEALAPVDVRIVMGRCLPYGEGITYWPVVETINQLGASPTEDAAAAAIRSLLGESDEASSAEEIAWAFRKLLEEQAPVIAVFDDIQWGEATFLDLLEHVSLLSSGASILLVAMARPELTERRAEWPVTLRLEPLGAEEVEELIPERISGELRAKIAQTAGGNPLFVEEMVAMAGVAGADVSVPPTLQALLAARLDQLEANERSVLERGAVEGEIFHRGALQALAPDEEEQVTPRLAALVRKGLIRPQEPQVAGEDGFRFRHLLIRDAAYAALPKATRGDLHQRYAAWLEHRGADIVELDELLGYHLEQAWRYRGELGLAGGGELAKRARRHLAVAGRRALWRQDIGAALNLLTRAAALMPSTETHVSLELDIVMALAYEGKTREPLQRARSAAERAAAAGDRVGELCALLMEGILRILIEPESDADQLATLAEKALPEFEAAGDDFAINLAYRALGQAANGRGQMDAMVEAFERATTHARRTNLPSELVVGWCSLGRFLGTTPLSELLAWQDEQDEGVRRNFLVRSHRAQALAALGRLREARAALTELRADLDQRGGRFGRISATGVALALEVLGGDPATAVAAGEDECRWLEELGHKAQLSRDAGRLAQAYYELGRLEDAEAWAGRGAKLAGSDDAHAQMLWRVVKAKVLARHGDHAEAERLARQAVEICGDTDILIDHAQAFASLAEVLALAGRPEAAVEAFEQALARCERKEYLVLAERVRARLVELQMSETAAERAYPHSSV